MFPPEGGQEECGLNSQTDPECSFGQVTPPLLPDSVAQGCVCLHVHLCACVHGCAGADEVHRGADRFVQSVLN